MAAMPFPFNGILLIQGNFPRVLSVLVLKIVSCLIPYIKKMFKIDPIYPNSPMETTAMEINLIFLGGGGGRG